MVHGSARVTMGGDAEAKCSGLWQALLRLRSAVSRSLNTSIATELAISFPGRGGFTQIARQGRHGSFDAGSNLKNEWAGFCAVCKRPLSISMTPASKRKRTDTGRYAYVISLWGSSPEYVMGAMVLGWSLRQTGTKHDLVV
eukprot:90623-Amphidinium_carterae.1